MTLMMAEVIFLDPYDVKPAIAELNELGFKAEILEHLIDPYSPAVWIETWGESNLSENQFFHWIIRIVGLLGGDVLEAGTWCPEGTTGRREASRED
jgi:hypothetical protein